MRLSFPKIKKSVSQDVFIGLDIGHNYLKLVKLKKESDKIVLDNFNIHSAHKDIPILLKKIVSECGLKTNKVNISLSGKSTIVRDIWMPEMSAKDLKASLGFEIDQYIPFPVEEVYYDSYILDESPLSRKDGQMRVVLAVAKKELVNERIKWLDDAGLMPSIIDMDAISIFNLFQKTNAEEKGTIGLVDIGSTKTIIDIATDNVLTFTREIDCGANKVKEWLMRGLSIGADEAEKSICSGDIKNKSWVQDFAGLVGKELWNSFEYYEDQEQKSLEKVYVTGGGSLLPEFANLLSQSVGLPVLVWDPLAKLEINLDSARGKEFQSTAPLFSNAVGLAYRF